MMTTTDELERSIRFRIEQSSQCEAKICELQRHLVYLRGARVGIERRYILEGIQVINEKQRQAWLAAALHEDKEYGDRIGEEQLSAESLATRERELRVTDRLRRLEMVLLQLYVDRRGEDHGTA